MLFALDRSLRIHARHWLIAGLTSAFALACFGWVVAARSEQASAVPANPAVSSAGFHPTESQWAALKVETVERVRFDSALIADGTIANNDDTTAAVYSPFSGRVIDIRAQLGQAVRRGAVLATILATEAAQSDSDLSAATSAEAIARQQLALAKEAETRQHELLLAEAGTQKEWRQSQSDLQVAENAHQAARAALNAIRTKASILGGLSSDPVDASGRGSITAPVGGIVVQRQISPGQVVGSLASGGATPMFTIADLRTVWVLANVSEADAGELKVGQAVEVKVLALPDRTFRSKIAWVAASIDPTTHRVSVRAELQNPEMLLKPQMSATVRLSHGTPQEVIAIPRSAVVYDGSQAHCYVVDGSHALVVRSVQVGRSQGPQIEVTSGLQAGERVVTRGTLFIDQASDDARS
jgi:cobalt-zinc-cadmium efflux system membrane fusion protein